MRYEASPYAVKTRLSGMRTSRTHYKFISATESVTDAFKNEKKKQREEQ